MKHLLLLLMVSLVVGCTSVSLGYTPPVIPIKLLVTVDTQGNIDVSVEISKQHTTPIGTFEVNAAFAREIRENQRTLTVLVEERQWVYDLESTNVDVEFTSEEYCKVRVTTNGDDVLIYVARNGSPECPESRASTEVTRIVVATSPPSPSDSSSPPSDPVVQAPSQSQPQPTQPPAPTPSCAQEVASVFRSGWSATGGASTSCPTRAVESMQGGIQYYDNGVMVWVPSTSYQSAMIYVIYNNTDRNWQEYEDSWREGQAESHGNTPPSGKIEPKRGFGTVWLNHLGGPNARIGWAVTQETAAPLTIQKLEGTGMAIQVDGRIYYMPDGRGWSQ